MKIFNNPVNKESVIGIEALDGITRKTLTYNKDVLMALFEMKAGSSIPLHNHIHSQIGYVVKGKVKFITENSSFIVKAGDSYVFNGDEKHGAEIIRDSEVIEVFSPCRDEYTPEEK